MNCDSARRLIDAYMDSELDSRSAMEVEGHLADCKPCQRLLEGRRDLRRAIKGAAAVSVAPAALRLKFERRTKAPWVRYMPLAAGLGFAVGVAAVLGFWRPWVPKTPGPAQILDDVFAHHSRSLIRDHLVDFASNKPSFVQTWFCGKIGYSPMVPKMTDNEFQLVGGRLDLVTGHTVPVLVYEKGECKIDVFVTPGQDIMALDADRSGMHIRSWSNCDLSYWAVSNGSTLDLDSLHQDFIGRH